MASGDDLAATGRPRGRPGNPARPAEEGQQWLSWEQAAAFVGCPVSTIDWHCRTGRITIRPRRGPRPTVSVASLKHFKEWWLAREERRAATAEQRAAARERKARARARAKARATGEAEPPVPSDPPSEGAWLSQPRAAERLGCSPSTVRRRIQTGHLQGVVRGTRVWVEESSLEALAEEEARWVSYAEAAHRVGCSTTRIGAAVRAGDIAQRPRVVRGVPSLDRASVEAFAARRAAHQRSRERELRAERRRLEARRKAQCPPQDGNVWLDATTAALLLGVSRARVGQLARRDRLPHHTSPAGRLWFRRDHLELFAGARARRQAALSDSVAAE